MTEEIKKSIEAQKNYCQENRLPFFAPYDGKCYRCGHQLFGEDGISLKGAGNFHITGCPVCHYSFCE